MFISLDQFN